MQVVRLEKDGVKWYGSAMGIDNLITNPPVLPLIAPSILSADFSRLGEECRAVLNEGGDLLHVDVMDGHFVPNLTLGPALCQSLRNALPGAFLDVHLMVQNPAMFVEPFRKAGADHFTFHVEVVESTEIGSLVDLIHGQGMTAGLAINPPTSLELLQPYIEQVDMVLVMSIQPGFSGQKFMPEVLDRVREIKARLRADQRLEMDGGINGKTAGQCREAGCDILAAASAVFGSDDYGAAMREIRGGAPVAS